MSVSRTLSYAALDDLYLDPTNPRLGRHLISAQLAPEELLEVMQGWELHELAASFLNSYFWPQEALIVASEPLYGAERLVVVEGNRRLAALKTLRAAFDEGPIDASWSRLIEGRARPDDLFENIPYLLIDDRSDVDSFLGFRHVTGIKQWRPAEKAQYIARLLRENPDATFSSVARDIGSKPESVRRHYAAYQLVLQLEQLDTDVTPAETSARFSVLFLSLRQAAVQEFLGVRLAAGTTPEVLNSPVPAEYERNLADFARWLFGTEERSPLFTDSRDVGDFARVLASADAVQYLRDTDEPQLALALRKANADKDDVLTAVRKATDHVEAALTQVHLVRDDLDVQSAVDRFDKSARELVTRTRSVSPS